MERKAHNRDREFGRRKEGPRRAVYKTAPLTVPDGERRPTGVLRLRAAIRSEGMVALGRGEA